jgi:polyhydroxybutyrate depolymerase
VIAILVALLVAALTTVTVKPAATEQGSVLPAAPASPGCLNPVTPGTSKHTITAAGKQRSYLLVIPQQLRQGEPAPVIMGLHGGSGTAEQAYHSQSLHAGTHAIFVYPQAPYWPEAGGVAWNVDPNGVDFPYFDTLIQDLRNKHCVDSSRIFAAGKSNGGFMVNSLACFRPGVFRAIAPVAGGGPQTTRCSQGVAVMVVHGSADQTVPQRQGEWSRDYWRAKNGDTGAAAVPTNPSPCVRYPGTQKPVLWCQHGGAHTWPEWTGPGIREFFLGL